MMVSEVEMCVKEGESKDKSKMQRWKSEGNRQPSRYRRMYNLKWMVVILCLLKDGNTSQTNVVGKKLRWSRLLRNWGLRGRL